MTVEEKQKRKEEKNEYLKTQRCLKCGLYTKDRIDSPFCKPCREESK